jgi:hypothetical protein
MLRRKGQCGWKQVGVLVYRARLAGFWAEFDSAYG